MGKENRRFYIRSFLIITLIGGGVLFLLFYSFNQTKKVEKTPVYTDGIIIQTYQGARGRYFVKFRYNVKGAMYFGSVIYPAHLQNAMVGDTCEVVYERDNPDNSKLVRDKRKWLKLRQRK